MDRHAYSLVAAQGKLAGAAWHPLSSGFDHDPRSERGHPCRAIRFGIVDYQQLQPAETVFTLKRARVLEAIGITGSST